MSGLGVWHSLAVDGAAAVSSSRSFNHAQLSSSSVPAVGCHIDFRSLGQRGERFGRRHEKQEVIYAK